MNVEYIEIYPEIIEEVDLVDDFTTKEKLLGKLIGQLNNLCQKIIYDFYFKRIRMEVIANNHGLKDADSAKSQKAKCMKKLKEYLNENRRNG